MGMAYLIYPGATHTRFEHSLGVMDLASRMYDTLLAPRNRIASLTLGEEEVLYWREILRLAALCHDFGHLPFSHTAETPLLGHGGHEKMTRELISHEDLKPIWATLGPRAHEDILKLATSDSGFQLTSWERVLSQIITEDNFGADRIDYLIRDGHFTGVSYGHFDYHQLIDSLRILPCDGGLSLGVTESGIQSVESLWISRYMMYKRVYQLPKSRIYTNHMRRFMCKLYSKGFPTAINEYLEETDYTVLTSLWPAAKRGDEDASILLKLQPAFKEILLEKKLSKDQVDALKDTFKDKIMIDEFGKKVPRRDFPVISERGDVITSLEASPFLRDIPAGEKPLCLFCHTSCSEEVRKVLNRG